MSRKRGLGRGLDALLGERKTDPAAGTGEPGTTQPGGGKSAAPGRPPTDELRELPVETIKRGKYQPRRDMREDALEELANSIRAQGVMQPIVVRPVVADAPVRYEIIAGERRWRASQRAGLDTIPAIIRDVPDEAAVALSLIENIQREDLNPVEEAMALQRLQQDFQLTQAEVAEAVGKSRVAVTNLLRLLNLSPDVRTMLEHGDLEMGHARALLPLDGPAQLGAAREVVGKELNVRQTEALVRKRLAPPEPEPATPAPGADSDTKRLARDLTDHLGAPVAIQHSSSGRGRVVISYGDLDELEAVLSRLQPGRNRD